MPNLLTEGVIRVRGTEGAASILSLPEVYQALVADRVAAFTALRPHQRHAWHAFLAQVAVLALIRAGQRSPPRESEEWRQLLRNLAPRFPDDAPWRLLVEDPAMPGFMQCPAPEGLAAYKRPVATPDDLDILVTSKNHDLKTSVAVAAQPDDWLYALVNLQTMGGFLGRGNYGIARMNGGYSSRPCLGLAPAEGGMGAHLVHDIARMIERRTTLLHQYEQYFASDDGLDLVWIEPWDGIDSLPLEALDPYFVEICRRVRLIRCDRRIAALVATSKARRIAAGQARGDLGDHWAPVATDGPHTKALSISPTTFRYDRLSTLLFDRGTHRLPEAMKVGRSERGSWRLVARGVAAGQGKTDGYHERVDIAFTPRVSRLLGRAPGEALAELSSRQVDEVREVIQALRFGVAVAASGGKDTAAISKSNREKAGPYGKRLDAVADAHFFKTLQERFEGSDEQRATARRDFVQRLVRHGEQLLNEAIDTVPCAAIHRHRAGARARSAYWWRLRRPDGILSDIFDTPEQEEIHVS